MSGPAGYSLTERQIQRIYRHEIRPFLFDTARCAPRPTLVLLGGQPGAGKSWTMRGIRLRRPDDLFVAVTGDALRSFHPAYEELLAGDDRAMPNITQQTSGPWVRMAIEDALDHRFSLILEGTFRDTAVTLGTAVRFADAGYRTELLALAVRAELSRLDCLDRYYALIASGSPGRWTPPSAHDASYGAIPVTVAAAQASRQVHLLQLTDRTGQSFYERSSPPGDSEPSRAAEALRAARARPLSPDAAARWLDRLHLNVERATQTGCLDGVAGEVFRRLVTGDAPTVLSMTHPGPVREIHDAALERLADRLVGPGRLDPPPPGLDL